MEKFNSREMTDEEKKERAELLERFKVYYWQLRKLHPDWTPMYTVRVASGTFQANTESY